MLWLFSCLCIFLCIMFLMVSNNFFFWWFFFEMSLFLIIPFYLFKMNFKYLMGAILYFLMQVLSSVFFIFGLLVLDVGCFMDVMNVFFVMSLVIKMGFIPFIFWYIEVMSLLNEFLLFLMLVVQKVPMLVVFYNLVEFLNFNFFFFILIISFLVSMLGGMKSFNLFNLLSFSSVSNMVIIMIMFIFFKNFWAWFYFLFYSFFLYFVLMVLKKNGEKNINFMKIFQENLFLLFLLCNMGGFPPTLGFLLKVMFLMSLKFLSLIFLFFFIIVSSLSVFFYLRMFSLSFFNSVSFGSLKNLSIMDSGIDTIYYFLLLMFLMFILLFLL
uniref:NADH-ubiquinone oxidoreductase chain 2 n=1 Tax=Paratomella rubra TaxID=90914 RepID=A0A1X9WD74_PARRR|nr:NADH dehydrogenase subunit 2 [Paratomella rubra]ARS00877.1 NADH dehydrogenase subunit 2 [Paratomella rubra]